MNDFQNISLFSFLPYHCINFQIVNYSKSFKAASNISHVKNSASMNSMTFKMHPKITPILEKCFFCIKLNEKVFHGSVLKCSNLNFSKVMLYKHFPDLMRKEFSLQSAVFPKKLSLAQINNGYIDYWFS